MGLLSRAPAWLPLLPLRLAGRAEAAAPGGCWHVSRSFYRDAQGWAVVLRGVTLSGKHKRVPCLDSHQAAHVEGVVTVRGCNALLYPYEVEPGSGLGT